MKPWPVPLGTCSQLQLFMRCSSSKLKWEQHMTKMSAFRLSFQPYNFKFQNQKWPMFPIPQPAAWINLYTCLDDTSHKLKNTCVLGHFSPSSGHWIYRISLQLIYTCFQETKNLKYPLDKKIAVASVTIWRSIIVYICTEFFFSLALSRVASLRNNF